MKKIVKKSIVQQIIKEELRALTPKQRKVLKEKLLKEVDAGDVLDKMMKHVNFIEDAFYDLGTLAFSDPSTAKGMGSISKQQLMRLSQAFSKFTSEIRKISNEIG